MHQFFITLFDYFFPPSEDEITVRCFSKDDMMRKYVRTEQNGIISLSRYSDNEIRALVHEAKFHGNKKAFLLLGALFQRYIEETHPHIDTIIPIPLSSGRLRARGYNQVHEILKTQEVGVLHILDTASLVRARNTRPQTELERSARLLNMHNAFSVKNSEKITGKHILVVDDVTTTGATLHSAKALLLPYHPASITLLAIAH